MGKFNLFLDTNIIIDLLADRKPFSNSAYNIFKEAKTGKWNLHTSSNSIITAFYILEKHISAYKANQAIRIILTRLDIQDVTKNELVLALKSDTVDLEDACQIECANKIGNIDYIVSRDKKGFKNSIIDVVHPDEFIEVNLS